jgi:hypothetical protein
VVTGTVVAAMAVVVPAVVTAVAVVMASVVVARLRLAPTVGDPDVGWRVVAGRGEGGPGSECGGDGQGTGCGQHGDALHVRS